ncbi:hypothetical protein DFH09DRAFT_1371332 [Mycena vulgaris]|nr:hypothetical protein DFH09DRAFT_1371332 [Mycena vulgaris]
MSERSASRGREALTSSGRGGMGNIRLSSSQDRPLSGPDDFSNTQGREPAVAIAELRSTGRGGAGNFRSPSRDPVDDRDVRSAGERDIIRAHEEREREALHSSGRGGLGNLSRSRSRGAGSPLASLSPTRTGQGEVHSSGRGGAGNIAPGPPPAYERGRTGAVDGVHSTGRGGIANLTAAPIPAPDAPVHHAGEYESTGRGGAGNMSRSRERSGSREARGGSKERGASKDHGEKGGIAGLWSRMHPHGHTPPETILEGGQPVGAAGGVGAVGVGGGRGGAI